MEGQQYLAVNPDTLHDSQLWSYRDLQKLAKAANIKANQKREDLIEQLLHWNRMRKYGTQTLVTQDRYESRNIENYEMNVVGNNFAVLAVQAKEKKFKSSKKRKSILGLTKDEVGVVSPTYLKPLKLDTDTTTPRKSCLKVSVNPFPVLCDGVSTEANTYINSSSAMHLTFESDDEDIVPVTPSKRMANICFSPFNSVKVIAHKDEIAYQEYLCEHEVEFKRICMEEEEKRRTSTSPVDSPVGSPQGGTPIKADDESKPERRSSFLFQVCSSLLGGFQ